MIVGVSESSKFNIDKVTAAGFDYIEANNQMLALEGLCEDDFAKRLSELSEIDNSYLVISTLGNVKMAELKALIEKCKDDIREANVPVYIENGMAGNDVSGYSYNDFTETRDIRKTVEFANKITNSELFGIAVNTGYTNLVAKNTRLVIEDAGEHLKLVHLNDNDGVSNSKQIPYTFTKGRGYQTTNWVKTIGALIRVQFEGRMVFDTEGLFNRMPERMADSMLKFLASIAMYWLHIIYFEEVLADDKQIILFGAGRMASNYLYVWGDKYKPSFLVDNNESKWGSTHRGFEIKSPEAILDVPEENRLVLICNAHHEEIGLQLRKMGVSYLKYNDNYYDFIPQ